MEYKTLQIAENFRENILYDSDSLALAVCSDHFDDYLHREWGCHWHDEFEFGLVLQGVVEYTIYNEYEQLSVHKISVGDGIFLNAGCFHSVKGLEPGTVMAGIILPTNFFNTESFRTTYHQNIYPILESRTECLVFAQNNPSNAAILSGLKDLYEINKTEQTYELHCMEAVCKISRLLAEQISANKSPLTPISKSTQTKRLQKIMTFIHAHYGERISADDMARAAAISRTEVFRCFQTVLRKKPVEYLTEYRLSIATILLASTDRTLSDISISCGFNSASYFGKVFREHHGISPKKYRDQFREK